MTDLDQVIRDGLRAEVDSVSAPDDGAERLVAAARSAETRRRTVVGTAAAVLVLVLGVGFYALTRSDDRTPVVTDGPDATETTTATSTTTTTRRERSERALDLVSAFLADLHRGDVERAAQRWGGPPLESLEPDEVVDLVEQFRAEHAAFVDAPSHEFGTSEAVGWGTPVVTVVGRDSDGQITGVAAFATVHPSDFGPGVPQFEGERIASLPSASVDVLPRSGSTLAPGDRLSLPFVPVEGGVTAHHRDEELAVEVDHAAGTTNVVVPDDPFGEVVITVSYATPELPAAVAVWYRVEA